MARTILNINTVENYLGKLNLLLKNDRTTIKLSRRNNYYALDICKLDGEDICIDTIDSGLTLRQAFDIIRGAWKIHSISKSIARCVSG